MLPATDDWATITPGLATYPKPMPITKHGRASCHRLLSAFTGNSSAAPTITNRAPISTVRRKPMVR